MMKKNFLYFVLRWFYCVGIESTLDDTQKIKIPVLPEKYSDAAAHMSFIDQEKKYVQDHFLFHGKNAGLCFSAYDDSPYKDALFISFAAVGDIRPNNLKERCSWGRNFFHPRKINCCYVGNSQLDWYQSKDMDVICFLVSELKKHYEFKRVISYGTSMGGYAALAFSRDMRVSEILSFDPQIILMKWPGFLVNQQKLSFPILQQHPLEGLSPDAPIYCFYAKNNKLDSESCEDDLMEICHQHKRSEPDLIPVPYDKHPCLWLIFKCDLLKDIIFNVLDGKGLELKEKFKEGGEIWQKILNYEDKPAQIK